MASTSATTEFPLDEARRIVRDLMAPRPLVYWLDFLFHITLGWAAFVATLLAPQFSVWQAVGYLVTALAFYRAVIFIHELAHLKRGTFGAFRLVWNILCGVPLLVPSFTYHGVHNDHHKRDVYGTDEDGEYLPFVTRGRLAIVLYVLEFVVLPFLFVARFVILTPVSYLHPALRRLVWAHASSLTIDLAYSRPPPDRRSGNGWRWQEFFAFVWGAAFIGLVVAGIVTWKALVLWYLVGLMIFLLNSLRTLAAHCYRNPGGRRMSVAEQYLDSVDVPGLPFVTALWAPVGLRFHATHHLFPAMPYHSLGEARRRLMRELPDNRLYAETLRGGLWDALARLWREAGRGPAGQAGQAGDVAS